MKIRLKILTFLLAVTMLLLLASCTTNTKPEDASSSSTADESTDEASNEIADETSDEAIEGVADKITDETISGIDKDREGNSITLPQTIDKIICMGPSNTEVLVALGYGDKIIATDDYSNNIEGLNSDIPLFSMMSPDGEQLIQLEPDVIFVTGMSKADGDDPFKTVVDAGICVIYIPSSMSIEGIKEDIRYMAKVMQAQEKGAAIIAEMEQELASIEEIGKTITEQKTVYFEISAAPNMYSFGNGVFLNEMIELIGAKNILSDEKEWISVADEVILAANPDVILTSVNYIDNPIEELKARPGWEEISAVQKDEIYYIDTDASNRPSQNIVKALKEMAKAIYPDKY